MSCDAVSLQTRQGCMQLICSVIFGVNMLMKIFGHSYISYTKMHRQATGLKPDNDYDLSRKVEFMKRIGNTQIANKIIRSNRFKRLH